MTKHKTEQKHGKGHGHKNAARSTAAVQQDKDKKARMFDHHDFTGGQTCGKHHVVQTKPESEYDHIGEDLFADLKAHKKNDHHHHNLHGAPKHHVPAT
ncbi:hypothetical protein IV203_001846 [Nitzschia inconspicua]|uniref:Uncharacterized protein n=1 Tax=Nitzschia inconspicua TaxID=303405 RepID=A0A9K3L849_9STRA|nr:hypothetical protein IV203_001846 [Nitzschia inconspicua]